MIKIYLITNLITGKQYVGKTKYSLAHRFSQHCNNSYYRTYLHNAIVKYGKENFKIEEICRTDEKHWRELEQYYIKFYHTHYTECGYNLTWSGDDNPMDDPTIYAKWYKTVSSEEHRQIDREIIQKYNSSELRKQHDLETSLRQSGIYNDNFRKWNNLRKCKVGMIKDNEIIMKFDSAADALRYLGKPTKEAGNLLKCADKYNKNGKRAKTFGYSWTIL